EEYNLKTVTYWCGVIQDEAGDTQEKVTARARAQALEFLRTNIAHLWPKATQGSASPVLNWEVLVDPENCAGEARVDSQYWRGNFQPSERYVLSVAGSTKFRLRANESGYRNLFLVGDWVRTGFDAGCIEAATMSGMQASRAICGYPEVVVGEKDPWF
ncbi:MAG TPA: FAD-dependent oxidoreductase, partial [Anaerolineales bacterium]|nr:FAD-dependent oxidoreductase [Anaerolineales bacterium]